MCTTTPLTSVSRLLPDGPGMHIALVSRQAVSVLALPRSRGRHGEFGGGQLSVNCRWVRICNVDGRIVLCSEVY